MWTFLSNYFLLKAFPQAGSRLDYVLVSSDFNIQKFSNKWLRFDHSMLTTEIFLTEIFRGKTILKDWSLASPLFLDQAPDIVKDILLNHDVNFRNISMQDRLQFVNERKVYQFEVELSVSEPRHKTRYRWHHNILRNIIYSITVGLSLSFFNTFSIRLSFCYFIPNFSKYDKTSWYHNV